MLVTRAIALQGMDFSPRFTGLQGLWGIEQTQTVTVPGGSGGGVRGHYRSNADEVRAALQPVKQKRTDEDIFTVLTLFVLGQDE